MLTYVLEASGVELQFSREHWLEMLQTLESHAISFSVEEVDSEVTLTIAGLVEGALHFRYKAGRYKLMDKVIQFADPVVADLFQELIMRCKGHATIKIIRSDVLYIHQIQYGEVVRITEVNGPNKKVLMNKETTITMEQVMESFKRRDIEEKIPLLREEIDSSLDRLAKALADGNLREIEKEKEKLTLLRREMLLTEM
ncbi:putative uncharacterized domain protein [[Clostridium] ultunense Esp]|uniref:hypothetical protein n=1 Tax=Thermicanus aegyptius TaxID=94009 RepID=UPI0002B6FC9F|nr:hypothetical protein [Thermicanus aegyptius]CCQ92412.1 putative uncharacterized domain protein [[Clostridium] ultunense Esp]